MGIKDFKKIRVSLASTEQILEWSFGEVKKPETINYRTLNPEMEGLFCERIFGPVKDWECSCGKYKRMRYKGLICEKCGVEITKSKVRRERMGHIDLAAPVAHIWYSKGSPNKMAILLEITPKDLESVIYFAKYVVTNPGDTKLKTAQVLSEREFKMYRAEFGNSFEALMGAEAIEKLLASLNLLKMENELKSELEGVETTQKRKKLVKKLKIVRDFVNSGNRPEWMILRAFPVIPSDLRPMVQLDGGRFATSDLNDLYRRIINRNNRLKKLQSIHAPNIVIKNEKRMLQEAVDALIDNGRRGKVVVTQNNRELKSLSDMLKGKQGRFRQNLLGKRVDYSGRSVIVVGPNLKMNQCGLPKKMALELYKPFIMRELLKRDQDINIKTAKKMVENEDDRVWEIIEEVIKEHPVLLNRAPTLHRLSIQAFEPVLIEGKAIRLHPLTCSAFNADFDGDQMAVHLALSPESIMEARLLMLASNNLIAPATGKPIAVPSQDMVMGCYYMTKERNPKEGEEPPKGAGKNFSSIEQAIRAYEYEQVATHALINVRINGVMVETTAGRLKFNEILPEKLKDYGTTFGKKQLATLIEKMVKEYGFTQTSEMINDVKDFGYHYAAIGGITVGMVDLVIPPQKATILKEAEDGVAEVLEDYKKGIIINEERYRRTVDIWSKATQAVRTAMLANLDDFNPVFMMANSGARGNATQMGQLTGMRGLMADTQGHIIELPVKANFKEGLTVLEFFMSAHGARKGLADTALRTADSGYLTRRLVDISHDVIVNTVDCGTDEGLEVSELVDAGEVIETLEERLIGRNLLEDIMVGTELMPRNTLVSEEQAKKIVAAGIKMVKIRSPLTCDLKKGVCQKCYGWDLSCHKEVLLGEAVGVIAAQSIGEPGTQLTMRTFHTGGVADKAVSQTTITADSSGKVSFRDMRTIGEEGESQIVVSLNAKIVVSKKEYEIPSGSILRVSEGEKVASGAELAEFDPYQTPIISEVDGLVKYKDIFVKETLDRKYNVKEKTVVRASGAGNLQPRIQVLNSKGEIAVEYSIPFGGYLMVANGEAVTIGKILVKILKEGEGAKDITGGLPRVQELFEARTPKGNAIVTEIPGKIELADKKKKGMRVVIVKDVENPHNVREYLIPFGEHLVVINGQTIQAGDRLTDGVISPHDILRIKGVTEAEKYILESVQQVYRSQGVSICDKHIEVIVRQMFKKVRIINGSVSTLLEDEVIDKRAVDDENRRLVEEGKAEITYEAVIQGITKAAVNTESFLSAASFQETTKVLANAAIQGKVDNLVGLKENVIIGKRIPAGTGFAAYDKIKLIAPELQPKEEEVHIVESFDEEEEEILEVEELA